MAAQIVLGPIIGRFSIGPISMHGIVNRFVGWLLMLILAEITDRFGNVSVMSSVAALGTRIIRLSALSGLVTGIGYAVGGLCFDVLYFQANNINKNNTHRESYILGVTIISGLLASVPYLLYKYLFFSFDAFRLYVPVHILSSVKGVLFSIAGTFIGLKMLDRLRTVVNLQTTPILRGSVNRNE